MQHGKIPVRSGVTLTLASLLLPVSSIAQVLEEVVVVAQKREENLQDVGISVTAFSGDQLESLGVTSTVDITQQVPAMQLFTYTPAFTVFSLRGISQNNFQDNLEAPVAVYVDRVYVATMNAINAQLYDVERVEVLRGPQGTLFGRNATGGLVHYLTRKATEDELNGYVQASAADFDTYSVEGAVGGAFSEAVRGRLAGRWETSEGYVEAGSAFGVQATGRTSHGADGYSVRGTLQINAGDDVTIDLTGAYSQDDDAPSGQYVVALAGFDPDTGLGAFTGAFNLDPVDPNNNPPVGPVDYDGAPITGDVHRHWSNESNTFFDRDVVSLTAQVTASIGAAELVSITNYTSMDKEYLEDAGGGFGFFPYNTINDYDQLSQEFHLSGGSERWRWQVGAYYLDMTWDTFQAVEGALIHGPGFTDAARTETFGEVDSRNWSVFGQAELDFAPRWTGILGLRWSQDDKELDYTRYFSDAGIGIDRTLTFDIAADPTPDIDTIDYGDYALRAQLNWTPADSLLLYGSYSRGIKGGNWSLDPLGGVPGFNLKHGEEVLNSYELGIKSELADGLARVNAAAFYYDYEDYQAFNILNVVPQVTNSDATASGGEVELVMLPMEGLDLMFGASVMDSEVDAVTDVFGGTLTAEFPNAPGFSLNWLARYEWPALGGSLATQIDGFYNDDQYLEGTNSEVSFEGAYAVWNARVSYLTGNEKLRLALWVKNLADEEYRLYNLDLGLLGFIEQVYAPPRQVGATFTYDF
jgi:iron complex outermembrane recepter protein